MSSLLLRRRPGLLKQFISDLHSGKLHREFHHGPDPTPAKVGITYISKSLFYAFNFVIPVFFMLDIVVKSSLFRFYKIKNNYSVIEIVGLAQS